MNKDIILIVTKLVKKKNNNSLQNESKGKGKIQNMIVKQKPKI